MTYGADCRTPCRVFLSSSCKNRHLPLQRFSFSRTNSGELRSNRTFTRKPSRPRTSNLCSGSVFVQHCVILVTIARLKRTYSAKIPRLGVPKRQPLASSHIKLCYYIIFFCVFQALFSMAFCLYCTFFRCNWCLFRLCTPRFGFQCASIARIFHLLGFSCWNLQYIHNYIV